MWWLRGCSTVCSYGILCFLRPGPAQGGGPASAEAVRHPPSSAAVHQIPEPEPVALAHLETDEAAHAGETGGEETDQGGFP